MLLYMLLLAPAGAGLLAFVIRNDVLRRALLAVAAVAHAALTLAAWRIVPVTGPAGWLGLDAPGLLFLSITSLLFLIIAPAAIGSLAGERHRAGEADPGALVFINAPEAVFTGCLLLFLSTMTLVALSRNLGVLWVGIEATTLVGAPLIYFHRHRRSLEAVWKYLMICSVGIALALLANFFLAAAGSGVNDGEFSLALDWLLAHAGGLDRRWLRAAVILFFVGYGTKLGLAPMHTWLPDAHSEAPSTVSALLSGALLNCSLLALLRVQQICLAAGMAEFGRDLFLFFGLISITVAAVFIIRQADYKRMLAYSSVENMGIIALGLGIGGGAVHGALLHTVCHSLTKAALFLLAGNLLATYGGKLAAEVRGAMRVMPRTALLWLTGIMAIAGTPPFGVFFSKYAILKAAVLAGHPVAGAWMMLVIIVIFMAVSAIVLPMVFGPAPDKFARAGTRERWTAWLPPLVFLLLVLWLGVHQPPVVARLLADAAAVCGGAP